MAVVGGSQGAPAPRAAATAAEADPMEVMAEGKGLAREERAEAAATAPDSAGFRAVGVVAKRTSPRK